MSVLEIEQYRQLNSDDILKVILKPTKNFPNGYFYCDSCDEELVRSYTWCLHNKKDSYVVANLGDFYSHQYLRFHQEKANNILNYYPDCINHINGIECDNVNSNLDVVTSQQNQWCRPTKGYVIDKQSFCPKIKVNSRNIGVNAQGQRLKQFSLHTSLKSHMRIICMTFLKIGVKTLIFLT